MGISERNRERRLVVNSAKQGEMKKGRAAMKFAVRAVCCVWLSGDRRFYLLTFTRRAGDACKDLGSTLECY